MPQYKFIRECWLKTATLFIKGGDMCLNKYLSSLCRADGQWSQLWHVESYYPSLDTQSDTAVPGMVSGILHAKVGITG